MGVSDLPEVHASRRRTEGRGWGGAPLGCCSCFCCWVRAEDHSQHVKLGGVTSWQGSESASLFQPRNGAEWEQAEPAEQQPCAAWPQPSFIRGVFLSFLSFLDRLFCRLRASQVALDGKESACSGGDLSSIPRSGGSPGEGTDNSLQHSCLENPMDREAWRATVHGVAKSWTQRLTL